jgi:gamma-butyrobetaine dioxygenase
MCETNLNKASWTPEMLALEWSNGQRSEFPSIWLRDNCPCDRDSLSGQRLIDIADLPAEPKISSVCAEEREIVISWESETRLARFDLAWLRDNSPGTPPWDRKLGAKKWLEGSDLDPTKDFAWGTFVEIRDSLSSRANWMSRLVRDGIAFLSGVPCIDCGILEAVQHIGIVAETNYGRVFNVRFVPRPENLADSDRGLGLHTDNPYRDPIPGFQALHFLIASVEGGESVFADGLAIAEHMRETEPTFFEKLTRTPVPFSFRSKDVELYSERPIIQISLRGHVSAIHYNNRSIAPVRLETREIPEFYRAYRHFAALLHNERFQCKFKLNEGDLVAFDNRRVLHGRTAFCSTNHVRHLQGCYLTRDSVFSQAARLRRAAFYQEQVA